jgi:hypothetical protein
MSTSGVFRNIEFYLSLKNPSPQVGLTPGLHDFYFKRLAH